MALSLLNPPARLSRRPFEQTQLWTIENIIPGNGLLFFTRAFPFPLKVNTGRMTQEEINNLSRRMRE